MSKKRYDVTIECSVYETYTVEADSEAEARDRWGESEPHTVRHQGVLDVIDVCLAED